VGYVSEDMIKRYLPAPSTGFTHTPFLFFFLSLFSLTFCFFERKRGLRLRPAWHDEDDQRREGPGQQPGRALRLAQEDGIPIRARLQVLKNSKKKLKKARQQQSRERRANKATSKKID